jgi:hypothetical protein
MMNPAQARRMMNRRGRFELLDPISGTADSHRGRDPGSGEGVIVHLLGRGDDPASRTLLIQTMELPPDAFEHVREIGDQDGACYVVTDEHYGVMALEEWLKRARSSDVRFGVAAKWRTPDAKTPDVEPPVAEAPEPPVPASSEFTRLFQLRKAGDSTPPPRPGAGEFTRFRPAAPAPSPSSDQSPAGAKATGEFTRLFRKPAEVSAPQPGTPPEPQAGEFTRLFSSPLAPDPANLSTANNADEITKLFRQPSESTPSGEFSRPSGTPADEAAPIAVAEPVVRAQSAGDFTRLLAANVASDSAADLPAPVFPATAAPGEYTRIASARPAKIPTPPPTAPPAQPSSAKPAATPDRGHLPQVLVFSFLALLAVGLILFAALHH